MSLKTFGRRMVDPKINKDPKVKESKTPLATNPVVARIRKTQFGNTTNQPTGINVDQVSKKAAALFSKAPKLQIHKL